MNISQNLEPLISVVVPVYNVEKYLPKCLDSLLSQTYKNLEIICVNDGSPDNSIKILQEYASKDSRIKVISQENKGLSGARNTGMKSATGELIYFIDSDDWISSDYLQNMYKTMSSLDVDVVIDGKHSYVWENGTQKVKKSRYEGVFEKNKFNLRKTLGFVMVWNKLYKRKFLEDTGVFYPEGVTCEDCFFYYTVFTKVRKFAIINNGTYFYRQNDKSLMSQIKSGKRLYDHVRVFNLIFDYYRKNNLLKDYYLPFNMLKSYIMYHKNKREAFDEIRDILQNLEYSIKNVSKTDKIFIKMVRDLPYSVYAAYLVWRGGFKGIIKNLKKVVKRV